MNPISVVRTGNYETDELDKAIGKHFDALKLSDEIRPGMRVLLKPNLITARKPAIAATTHPALIGAIVKALHGLGVTDITLADSPGGPYLPANLKAVYSVCGLQPFSDRVALNMDVTWRNVTSPAGCKIREFSVITPALEADYIINLPKLKTHGMMTLSAAVKNLFGLIPGLQKPEMHYRLPEKGQFAGMLNDLALTVPPALTIVDAVDGMEGNGPTGGSVKHLGLTLASKDVFLLDFYAAGLIGLKPDQVPTIVDAISRGLFDPDTIRILTDEKEIPREAFRLPDSMRLDFMSHVPRPLVKPMQFAMNAWLKPYPFVEEDKCIGCGKCAESCPPKIIHMVGGCAKIDKRGCIGCFCCQEMCPAKAIRAMRRRAVRK